MKRYIFALALVVLALSACKKNDIPPFNAENANYADTVIFEPSSINLSSTSWADVIVSSIPDNKNYILYVDESSKLSLTVLENANADDYKKLLKGTSFVRRGVSSVTVNKDGYLPAGKYEVIAKNTSKVLGRLEVVIE